ncbi:hypothetical protein Sjap_015067 [Stephania japonica]|uniref:Cycloidea-like protein n=1 Tax=Stephania japonica TaxID=461633 RepID=A0AAP0IIW4_9MAGN
MFRHEYSIEDLSSIFSQPFITEDDQQQQQQPHFIPSQLSKLQQQSSDQLATTSDDIDAVHHNTYSRTALNGDKGASRAPSKRVITKRFGRKKDRHSKITTAQGIRDRRMRLSLEVAHKFFTLQDMLGLDKASKTVEWLLTMSKSAIKKLAHQESLSHHNPSVDDDQIEKRKKEGGVLPCKSAAFDHLTVKESRAKRRERARERTIEKMRNRTEETSVSHSQGAVHDQACPNIIEDSFHE